MLDARALNLSVLVMLGGIASAADFIRFAVTTGDTTQEYRIAVRPDRTFALDQTHLESRTNMVPGMKPVEVGIKVAGSVTTPSPGFTTITGTFELLTPEWQKNSKGQWLPGVSSQSMKTSVILPDHGERVGQGGMSHGDPAKNVWMSFGFNEPQAPATPEDSTPPAHF